jgi:hypothetical protein
MYNMVYDLFHESPNHNHVSTACERVEPTCSVGMENPEVDWPNGELRCLVVGHPPMLAVLPCRLFEPVLKAYVHEVLRSGAAKMQSGRR